MWLNLIWWCAKPKTATLTFLHAQRRERKLTFGNLLFSAPNFPHSWKRYRAVSERVCLHKKKERKTFCRKKKSTCWFENYCVAAKNNPSQRHAQRRREKILFLCFLTLKRQQIAKINSKKFFIDSIRFWSNFIEKTFLHCLHKSSELSSFLNEWKQRKGI